MTNERPIAIVTGAARRVGHAIASALLTRGWQVVAQVRRDGDEVPEGAIRVAADLSDATAARTIFAAAPGPVALLVNNAARFAFDSLDAPDAGEFDLHMAINVRTPMMLIAEMASAHRGGTALVVNIGDAKRAAPNPDYLSYTLSKFALDGLTDVTARALAERGIRVNMIAPSLMLPSGEMSEDDFARLHAMNPLGQGVSVEDLVGALLFLVDQKAMTGQTLLLDGGQQYMRLDRDVAFLEQE